MNKQKLIIVVIAMAISATFFTIDSQKAHAQEDNKSQRSNYFQDLSQYISQKFGIDKNKVQTAVDEYHNNHKLSLNQRQFKTEEQIVTEQKDRLDQFVKEGKITSAQENLILSELASLRQKYNHEILSNLSVEDRKTKMTEMRNEILTWAKANNIDSFYLNPGRGMQNGKHCAF